MTYFVLLSSEGYPVFVATSVKQAMKWIANNLDKDIISIARVEQ